MGMSMCVCVDLGFATVLAGCDWGVRVRRVRGMGRVDWDCEFIRVDGKGWSAASQLAQLGVSLPATTRTRRVKVPRRWGSSSLPCVYSYLANQFASTECLDGRASDTQAAGSK